MKNLRYKAITSLIFVISFFSINSSSAIRTLNYQYVSEITIDIKEMENGFRIESFEASLDPFEAPMHVMVSVDKDEIKNLAYVFSEIFQDSKEKSIMVNRKDLTETQNEIILNVLKRYDIIYELKYQILNNVNLYDYNYTNRGYKMYYDKDIQSYVLTIAMGKWPTGGYSIYITKIKLKGFIVTIDVKEKTPFEGEIVTEDETYPIIKIKFNADPIIIEIINSDTQEAYPRYKYEEN